MNKISIVVAVAAALALPVAMAQTAAPAKPAAKTSKAAPKAKPAPVDLTPDAGPEQIDAAGRVFYGPYECELGQKIDVVSDPAHLWFVLEVPERDLGGLGRGPQGDPAGQPGGRARSLADRQAELVGALTAGRPVPDGFDVSLVEAARVALLRKRAGEVARQWPALATGLGGGWARQFGEWAAARPTQGSSRDGWDFARALLARGALPPAAAEELAAHEAASRYDGASAPRPRRAPAMRFTAGAVAFQLAGRVRILRRPR